MRSGFNFFRRCTNSKGLQVTNASAKSYSHDASHSGIKSEELYPGHRPTTSFQKALLTGLSGVAALIDPARDDMICAMGEASGSHALSYIQNKMRESEDGRKILWERPFICKETVNIEYLGSLPDNSFGKAYWTFLKQNGFDPDSRRPVTFIDDKELAYVMLRYRQIHDLTHTLLGMRANMLGEVAVKWFEAYQTRLPMCVAAAVGGPLRLGPKHSQIFWSELMSWSVQNAVQGQFLMSVYFEKHWATPISELRRSLNITPPPTNGFV